jgi:hypothetical protein
VLRIRPRADLSVWRTIEFSAGQTLHDVHCAIRDAFGLDDDDGYVFQVPGTSGEPEREYGAPRTRTRGRAGTARLDRLPLAPGSRLLHRLDLGEGLWHEIEVLRRLPPDPDSTYPIVLEEHGLAPAPYLPWLPAALGKATGDAVPALRVVDRFARVRHALLDPRANARDLLRRLAGIVHDLTELVPDGKALDRIEALSGADIRWWLTEVPTDLSREGLVDEAIEVATRLAAVERADAFLCDRAIILARAGRYDDAEAEAEDLLRRSPRDVAAILTAAQVFDEGGWLERAEELYRRVDVLVQQEETPEAEPGPEEEACPLCQAMPDERRMLALGFLESLLERQGRRQEAGAVRRRRQELLAPLTARMAEASAGALPLGGFRAPRIGRNEPCPCGSGRKFKRCCGFSGRTGARGPVVH